MHNVRIFKLICAITSLFVVALLAAYCAADDWQWQLALAEAEAKQATGTMPSVDPAPPVTTAPSEVVVQAATSRPPVAPVVIKAAGPHWTHPMANSKATLIDHLLSDGVHRGKHTRAQLQGLTYAQLETLHDNDHNATRATQSSYCPNCNNPRRGLFGRR